MENNNIVINELRSINNKIQIYGLFISCMSFLGVILLTTIILLVG